MKNVPTVALMHKMMLRDRNYPWNNPKREKIYRRKLKKIAEQTLIDQAHKSQKSILTLQELEDRQAKIDALSASVQRLVESAMLQLRAADDGTDDEMSEWEGFPPSQEADVQGSRFQTEDDGGDESDIDLDDQEPEEDLDDQFDSVPDAPVERSLDMQLTGHASSDHEPLFVPEDDDEPTAVPSPVSYNKVVRQMLTIYLEDKFAGNMEGKPHTKAIIHLCGLCQEDPTIDEKDKNRKWRLDLLQRHMLAATHSSREQFKRRANEYQRDPNNKRDDRVACPLCVELGETDADIKYFKNMAKVIEHVKASNATQVHGVPDADRDFIRQHEAEKQKAGFYRPDFDGSEATKQQKALDKSQKQAQKFRRVSGTSEAVMTKDIVFFEGRDENHPEIFYGPPNSQPLPKRFHDVVKMIPINEWDYSKHSMEAQVSHLTDEELAEMGIKRIPIKEWDYSKHSMQAQLQADMTDEEIFAEFGIKVVPIEEAFPEHFIKKKN